MARFVVRTPITTREPTITVDEGLAVGRHRFRLEVVDNAGLRSAPDEVVVEVQRIVVDPGPVGPGPIVVNPGPIVVNPGPVINPTPGPVINPGPIVRPPIVRSSDAVEPPEPDAPAPRSRPRKKRETS